MLQVVCQVVSEFIALFSKCQNAIPKDYPPSMNHNNTLYMISHMPTYYVRLTSNSCTKTNTVHLHYQVQIVLPVCFLTRVSGVAFAPVEAGLFDPNHIVLTQASKPVAPKGTPMLIPVFALGERLRLESTTITVKRAWRPSRGFR